MRLETTRFGIIDVDEGRAVTFEEGLPGFPNARRFVLLEHAPESPFHWLQSLDDGSLAFVVMDPLLVVPDYLESIPPAALEELGVSEIGQAAVLLIVRIQSESRRITANLLAPLVINPENRKGKQVILLGSGYEIQHELASNKQDKTAVLEQNTTAVS